MTSRSRSGPRWTASARSGWARMALKPRISRSRRISGRRSGQPAKGISSSSQRPPPPRLAIASSSSLRRSSQSSEISAPVWISSGISASARAVRSFATPSRIGLRRRWGSGGACGACRPSRGCPIPRRRAPSRPSRRWWRGRRRCPAGGGCGGRSRPGQRSAPPPRDGPGADGVASARYSCLRPGALAQMGERLDRTQEVSGSIPLCSMPRKAPQSGAFRVPGPSLSGRSAPAGRCSGPRARRASPAWPRPPATIRAPARARRRSRRRPDRRRSRRRPGP